MKMDYILLHACMYTGYHKGLESSVPLQGGSEAFDPTWAVRGRGGCVGRSLHRKTINN